MIEFTKEEVDLFRQWFDNEQALNRKYLEQSDYKLAKKLYEKLGMRVPSSIIEGANPRARELR
jgi:hypothetical protein